tara:strand:+ start:78 stop:854 length:777 start_codon:yes stop_codon:yes gene_type:complete
MAGTASVTFTPEALIGKIDEIEKVLLPRAASSALKRAAFVTSREFLKKKTKETFQNPVPLTQNAFLYDPISETSEGLETRIFVRDWISKGNSPNRYLSSQIHGGKAYRTRFAKALGFVRDRDPQGMGGPVLAPNEVMIPTGSRFVRRNTYGNMTQGQYTQILSHLKGGESSAGGGRSRNTGRIGQYFYLNREQVEERRNLKSRSPGIFLKRKGRIVGKVMQQSLVPVNPTPRFQFYKWTEENIKEVFAQEVLRQLRRI